MKLICPDCGTQYDSGKFCQECGAKLQEVTPELVCPSCGYKAKSGKFCPECGTKLTEQTPVYQASTVPEKQQRTFNERDSRFAKYYNKKGFPRTIPQEERTVAKEELAPYVSQDIAEAKMLLGFTLFEESMKSNERDVFLKSESLIKEAAEAGDKFAYYVMGLFYFLKGETEKLDEAEKRLLECNEEYQDGDSAGILAEMYAYTEAKLDYKKAFEYATIAADDDEVSGYQVLGALYLNGWGVEKNLEKAEENYIQAAAFGDELSMNQIGYIYLGQEGGQTNPDKAFYWFNEASKKGDDMGMYNLGCCYREGFGVEADYETAAEWFKKSADMGNVSAMKDLGQYYQEVLIDGKKAKKWFTKAAETGDAESKNLLATLYANEGNYKNAIELFNEAMEQGNSWAFRNYALCLWNGDGCEEDKDKAIEMMQKAVSLGNSDAEQELAEMQQNYDEETKDAETVHPSNELHIPEGTTSIYTIVKPLINDKDRKEKITTIYLPKSTTDIPQSLPDMLPNLRKIVIPYGDLNKLGYMLPYEWPIMFYENGRHVCPELIIPEYYYVYSYGMENCDKGRDADGHVLIPPTCSSICKSAFEYNDKIISVSMPDSVTSIGKSAFASCKKMEYIRLSRNLTVIPKSMLEFCNSLKEIVVPEGVVSIEQAAFANCKSLESITLPSTIVRIDKGGTFGSNPFQYDDSLTKIIVPKGTIQKFEILLKGFGGNPANLLVEAESTSTEEKQECIHANCKGLKNSGVLPIEEIREGLFSTYLKKSHKDLAVAVYKIAEVIQERLPEADVTYLVCPYDLDPSADQDALPIHFLFKENGVPRVAVVVVTSNGYRAFSVQKTQNWCKSHNIEYVRVYADGPYADWITGWSKFHNAPTTPQATDFCKNWLVEKISKNL